VLVDSKPERSDKVKGRGRRSAQAGDVARVGGDLRLDENDVERRDERFGAKARGRLGGHAVIYRIAARDQGLILR
jgi:hypothetical protein